MTAVERLDEIEARARDAYRELGGLHRHGIQIASEDVPALTVTVRAVLELLDGGDMLAALAGKDEGRIPTSALRLVIDAALDVTS